jgi:hypothetical protein
MPGGLTPGIRAVIKFHSLVPKHGVDWREATTTLIGHTIDQRANTDKCEEFLKKIVRA